MMSIDKFINQLIQLGLAESFLEVINKHYLKVTKLYSIISVIDENNVRDIDCKLDSNQDSITLWLHIYNPVENIEVIGDNELSIQIVNNGNVIEIIVSNNYESEEEIYEIRFNGHAKSNYRKWS